MGGGEDCDGDRGGSGKMQRLEAQTFWIVIVFVPKYINNILFIHIETMKRYIRYVRHILMSHITVCNILTRHSWRLCNMCSHFLAFLPFYSFYHSILSVCNSSHVMYSF